MGVRIEYDIRELPQSYVTSCTEHAYEQDGDKVDKKGNAVRVMVEKKIEKRGGWLLVVRGNPGHSIRLESREQAEALGVTLAPRLVNTETGEVCNSHGIPLSVASVVGDRDNAGGQVETDIDVNTSDEQLFMDLQDPAESAVASAITKSE